MWTLSRRTSAIICADAMSCTIINIASAQSTSVNSTNSNTSFNLPQAPRPNGFDQIRTSTGTTCRSSMSGNGSYLDMGAISQHSGQDFTDNTALYARLVIPLGKKPQRIDCSKLYSLEIERLQIQLEAARNGKPNPFAKVKTIKVAGPTRIVHRQALAPAQAQIKKTKTKPAPVKTQRIEKHEGDVWNNK